MTDDTNEPTFTYLPKLATSRTVHTGLGTYDGKELRDYEGRTGAMDAFRLPSLVGGKRTFPRENREQK